MRRGDGHSTEAAHRKAGRVRTLPIEAELLGLFHATARTSRGDVMVIGSGKNNLGWLRFHQLDRFSRQRQEEEEMEQAEEEEEDEEEERRIREGFIVDEDEEEDEEDEDEDDEV